MCVERERERGGGKTERVREREGRRERGRKRDCVLEEKMRVKLEEVKLRRKLNAMRGNLSFEF